MRRAPPLSVAVVGADYPNKRGPGRRFEIEMCKPGEPLGFRPEPKNPKDPRALAVYSCRDVQIGYVRAEQAQWFGSTIAKGREIQVIFQAKAPFGAWARVAFDGELPILPPAKAAQATQDESGFWPDELWTD